MQQQLHEPQNGHQGHRCPESNLHFPLVQTHTGVYLGGRLVVGIEIGLFRTKVNALREPSVSDVSRCPTSLRGSSPKTLECVSVVVLFHRFGSSSSIYYYNEDTLTFKDIYYFNRLKSCNQ